MSILAFDLGASGGRAMLGRLNDHKMLVEEIHRFPNDPVQIGNRLQWDILRLYHEIKQGLLKSKQLGVIPSSLGIDSWAVDFGLISASGELLANPYHYRDTHTNGVMERLFTTIPASELFRRTGIQFLPFNTIYQLMAMKQNQSPQLEAADRMLMIPDLLRYFLTGSMTSEFTNVTTTQLYSAVTADWDFELIRKIGLSESLFSTVVNPGTITGSLRSSVTKELGLGAIPVYAVAEHDTGSAVVSVPALERNFAFLSCGTWSLMGTEVGSPVINETARALNFTNEGGAYGTYRLLKNIMGLWILQECRSNWKRKGIEYSFPELVMLADGSPSFRCFIDPDDEVFLIPGDMPSVIQSYAKQTSQSVPREIGEFVRCILESLALKYRYVLEMTEQISGHRFNGLHMVGGGIHNELLCQWTANAIGKPVWAGPAEGSAIGNLTVQWIAQGELSDIWEARRLIRESFGVKVYEPEQQAAWAEAYGRFRQITNLTSKIQ